MFVLLSLYFRLICVLSALFLTLSAVAPMFGGQEPPHPALEGFGTGCDDQPQPCWYGIVVGQTTWEEARAILQALGYDDFPSHAAPPPDLCDVGIGYVTTDEEIVTLVQLFSCPDLRLGNVAQRFGVPDSLTTLHNYNYPLLVYERATDLSVAITQTNSLYTPVFFVEMSADGPDMIGDLADWRGYMHHRRYCKGESEILYCQYN